MIALKKFPTSLNRDRPSWNFVPRRELCYDGLAIGLYNGMRASVKIDGYAIVKWFSRRLLIYAIVAVAAAGSLTATAGVYALFFSLPEISDDPPTVIHPGPSLPAPDNKIPFVANSLPVPAATLTAASPPPGRTMAIAAPVSSRGKLDDYSTKATVGVRTSDNDTPFAAATSVSPILPALTMQAVPIPKPRPPMAGGRR